MGTSPFVIDFRRSLPPRLPALHSQLVTALDAVGASQDLGVLMHQSIPCGAEADRAAGCEFLKSRLGPGLSVSRVVIANGTQSALLLLLRALVGADGLLLAERLSYGPLRALAQIAGVRVHGLDIDDDGIVPESFQAACRADKPKALYCNPTSQNPTAAITPRVRRMAIADIARRHGVAIIEDDALGRLLPEAPEPIAALAPDITWYVMGTTKCLSQALRVAYVVKPTAAGTHAVIAPIEHLSFWHPPALHAAIVTHWIGNGAAARMSHEIAQECIVRERVAREALVGLDVRSHPGSMHIWLALPQNWRSSEFARAAEQRGILVRPAELFAVDDQPAPQCIRLSLSTPDSVGDVARGLEAIRALIEEPQRERTVA